MNVYITRHAMARYIERVKRGEIASREDVRKHALEARVASYRTKPVAAKKGFRFVKNVTLQHTDGTTFMCERLPDGFRIRTCWKDV